ncbi:MAG: hypothetical protein KA004_16295 [Verrucomicrobiales bacterium]|nr:hypothetical protein [Verrucomicrobiales bacterium]
MGPLTTHPTIPVVRQGSHRTAWTSADGSAWERSAAHFIPAGDEMDSGIVFRALPQDALACFQAKTSHLKIEPDLAKDLVLPEPVSAKNTAVPRLTGVVLAPSDPMIVAARSSIAGDHPADGLIGVCGEMKQGKLWWRLATDGPTTPTTAVLRKPRCFETQMVSAACLLLSRADSDHPAAIAVCSGILLPAFKMPS